MASPIVALAVRRVRYASPTATTVAMAPISDSTVSSMSASCPIQDIRTGRLTADSLRKLVKLELGRRTSEWALRRYAIAVFKSVRDSPSVSAPTWTSGMSARCAVQDHPAYIPRQPRTTTESRTGDDLIRWSGRIVQDRPLRSLRWADIPQLSAWDAPCPAAWQQCWQQSRRPGADPRPSANAGHIPSWRGFCERYPLSPVAAGCRWSLLLLSPLLSTRRSPSGGKPTRTLQGMARVRSGQAPAWLLVSVRSVRRGLRGQA